MEMNSDNIMDKFREITAKPHEYAKSLKEKGRRLAGYMCTHVPEEILYAAGFVPLRILSAHESQSKTRSYIHETYCSFSHDCAYQGLQQNYDYLDLLTHTSSCIHMAEAFNVWVRFAGYKEKSYLITYPHIIHTKHAGDIMVKSFRLFKEFVENFVGKPVTDTEIEGAIKVYNHTRRLLIRLWEFQKTDPPPISGYDVATVSLAAQIMDKQEFNKLLEELMVQLETGAGKASPEVISGVRLMVTGGACDDLRMFNLLEDLNTNTNLVFVDSCTAARYFWFEVAENSDDKLKAIAEGHISRIPCPSKDTVPGSGEKKRFRILKQYIEDYRPDGVVMLYQRFCSPQSMDIMALKPILKNLGIPWTELELDTTVPRVQFGTQLEALVETIKRVEP